jgi:hypothetical protein
MPKMLQVHLHYHASSSLCETALRNVLVGLCIGGALVAVGAPRADETKPAVSAGWLGVFPSLPGYQRTYKQPVVNKDMGVYQQAVDYQWMGNDFRVATATLARDPEFKKAHVAETLKQAGAKEIKIGQKDAWIIPNGKKGAEARDKIIVPLGEDKALIVEGIGASHKAFPAELAGLFDLEKASAALEQPPRTEFGRSAESFKQLKPGMSLGEVQEWIGEPDRDVGSGIHVMEYKLPDKSRVLIGFPSFDKLIYVKHEKDGRTEDLVK